jgi:hypothetical protein
MDQMDGRTERQTMDGRTESSHCYLMLSARLSVTPLAHVEIDESQGRYIYIYIYIYISVYYMYYDIVEILDISCLSNSVFLTLSF